MKKVGLYLGLLMGMFFTILPSTAYGADPERWGNYDVRTKHNGELTADLLNSVFEKNGQGGVLLGLGGAIMEAGEKNGINPGILAGFIIHESGWGKSGYAKNNNNLGGVRCKKGFECRNGFTVFDSPAHSIQVQAELLAGKTYVKGGNVTLKQILEIYAPPSDGNTLYGSGGYIAVVGSLMENSFKQTVDSGEVMAGTGGSYTEGGSGSGGGSGNGGGASVGSWAKYDFFMTSQSAYNGVGLDTSDSAMPSELSYGLQIFSDKTYKWLVVVGVWLSLALIVYMAVTVLFYVSLVKGIGYRTDVFEKMTKIDGDIHSRKALLSLVWRMGIGICFIAFFMTGLYIEVMALVYTVITTLLDYLI